MNTESPTTHASQLGPPSPLQDIVRRIEGETEKLRMIADNLDSHADRLFGKQCDGNRGVPGGAYTVQRPPPHDRARRLDKL